MESQGAIQEQPDVQQPQEQGQVSPPLRATARTATKSR
jgi:hypothetical protein